ncbi:MAG: hypothetical protein EHM89_00540 [Acidobacteria bacterium]|nr:MAG: hypothetical protein EHM89_00540 [Acidobacteriota bacterium]
MPTEMVNGRFILAALLVFSFSLFAAPALAITPTDRPPNQGGYTRAMGTPPLFKTTAGLEFLSYHTSTDLEIGALLNLGLMRYIGNPVEGFLAFGVEGYVGGHASEPDLGGRAYLTVPSLLIGAGVDYSAETGESDLILKLDVPMRRKGIVGAGSAMTFRWLPHREQTFTVGLSIPIGDRDAGRTRPQGDYVKMDNRKPARLQFEKMGAVDSTFVECLRSLRARAAWVARLTQPFSEYGGVDAANAMAPRIAELRAHMAKTDAEFPNGHTLNEEIRVYHNALDRLFSIAESGRPMAPGESTEAGRRMAAHARLYLLDNVIFPYNSLIGQLKKVDGLSGMIAVAHANFARGVLAGDDFEDARARRVLFAFQSLCDMVAENQSELRERWDDNRHVWLPLQYGLTPEEHDTQEELNGIIARATGEEFTRGNRVWYIMDEAFQYEMARSVRLAVDYHVLWIHDIRGLNANGDPDAVAYELVRNYLMAFAERVRSYNTTGKFPMYIVLLDQHFFEGNKSRLWIELLEDPLRHRLRLPAKFAEWEHEIERLQDDLRKAVDESLMLQVEKNQYGEKWLHNRIRVQVNITNPADYSFYSLKVVGKLPIPDNNMRDHRKIVFYDVTEDDPYRGMAMFTGMGIGEHYTGATWEDRALMLQGPGALATKDAARFLFKTQGFRDDQIPHPLRARPKPKSYEDAVAGEMAARSDYSVRSRVIELHNETGFSPKPLNVAKCVLYSLMPPGSVIEVPDPLWQSYIYASLIAGSSLRGCRSLVIAPSLRAAPGPDDLGMARANGLMKRLVVFGNAMDDYMEREGGILKVGLYAPRRRGAGDIAGRFQQGMEIHEPWMNRVYHLNAAMDSVASNAGRYLDEIGYQPAYATEEDSLETPKLHLKANLFASPQVWDGLMTDPGWGEVLKLYIQYLARQQGHGRGVETPVHSVREVPEELARKVSEVVNGYYDSLTPEQQNAMISFFTIGSANMDYRSEVMNGEVMVTIGGPGGLVGVIDFVLLAGLCEWPATPEQVDELLPPPGWFTRRLSAFIKVAL